MIVKLYNCQSVFSQCITYVYKYICFFEIKKIHLCSNWVDLRKTQITRWETKRLEQFKWTQRMGPDWRANMKRRAACIHARNPNASFSGWQSTKHGGPWRRTRSAGYRQIHFRNIVILYSVRLNDGSKTCARSLLSIFYDNTYHRYNNDVNNNNVNARSVTSVESSIIACALL